MKLAMKGFAVLALAGMLATPAMAAQVSKAPPGGKFKKVSTLVKLPDFLPHLGQLYVDPKTLPAGPFLAYDHNGKLVSTIYMIPLKTLNDHKALNDLPSPGGKVDHVDLYFNAGHPGVEQPALPHRAMARVQSWGGACRKIEPINSRAGTKPPGCEVLRCL